MSTEEVYLHGSLRSRRPSVARGVRRSEAFAVAFAGVRVSVPCWNSKRDEGQEGEVAGRDEGS